MFYMNTLVTINLYLLPLFEPMGQHNHKVLSKKCPLVASYNTLIYQFWDKKFSYTQNFTKTPSNNIIYWWLTILLSNYYIML